MPWLLDTNVLSELAKPRIDYRVAAFVAETPLDEMYISVVTLAEIRYGVYRSPNRVRSDELEDWIKDTVRPMFRGRVLPLSEDVLVRWRTSAIDGQRAGRIYSQPDLLIAATALEYGFTLATRK